MDNSEKWKTLSSEFERILLLLDKKKAEELLINLSKEYSFTEVINILVVKALAEIGRGWEMGRYSLSQVYMSGRICEELIDKLLPAFHFFRKNQPLTAICVLHDYHQLGKRVIYSSLRASGFELMDFGYGLSVEEVVALVKKHKIKVLLVSTLMLPSALKIKDLKKQLIDLDVKIIVGGAPFFFDSNLWKEVGADAVGFNGADALKIIDSFSLNTQ
ncbi:MAG: cobalamin B12-binding domain-containing protein [Bacteroidetes bacterium]|nr:cobalamin B12-binding domain-containing protein [Bacteroidota bacterium]